METVTPLDQINPNLIPQDTQHLSDDEVIKEIHRLKNKLASEVVVLGHHYQSDEIIQFADITGDSLKLAEEAARVNKPYIIFCGVHFMAETADILTQDGQKVILPDPQAGCSMADMARKYEVEPAWSQLASWSALNPIPHGKALDIIPITYINCEASLKAFVGKNHGAICTSSNAKEVIQWALSKGNKLFFFPDQHLGRNTCHQLGIPLDEMVVYDPQLPEGGLTPEAFHRAQVILWYGFCSVHQGFQASQIANLKRNYPEIQIWVHPECTFDVVQAADRAGSTANIISWVRELPEGGMCAIGTEINLVNRLAQQYPKKKIVSLSPYQCLCTTMYRIRPRWLYHSLKSIECGRPENIVSVTSDIKAYAKLALARMLAYKSKS